jgi:hypothetical protein
MPKVTVSSPGPDAKARGCWYYGCFTLGMMLLVAFLSIFLGGRYFLKTFVREYTSEKPVELPKSDISEEGWGRLQARLRAFHEGLDGTNGVVWLELSAMEINALIARDPVFAEFKDHLVVTLDGETAKCQFSYLLERLGAHKILHGRYLNGSAQLTPNLVGGKIYLTLLNIQINGKTVPDTVKPGLQAHNLAGNFNDGTGGAAVVRRLAGITIQKGKVLVAARGARTKP